MTKNRQVETLINFYFRLECSSYNNKHNGARCLIAHCKVCHPLKDPRRSVQ